MVLAILNGTPTAKPLGALAKNGRLRDPDGPAGKIQQRSVDMYPSPFHRLWLLILLVVSSTLHAQTELTGEVDYPYLGIKLTIPAGWKGIVDGEYLLLGSDTEAGLIGLTLNEARSTAQLKQVADAIFLYPEALLILLAVIIGIGSYSGYRLSDLRRFEPMERY